MNKKINKHGIISVILFFAAITLGIIAMLSESILCTIIYLVFLLIGFFSVIFSYCTKCAGRFHCGHIVIGEIAQRFPRRKQTEYTKWDYIGVIIPLLIILLFPQLFLFKIKWMFIVFWILIIVAVFEIKLFVCTKCKNSQCFSCKMNYTNTH